MEFFIVAGWIAICLSSCFYFSLSIPFFQVLRCKMNYEYTPINFVSAVYVDCFAWYIYGLKILSEQIMLSNKIGICSMLALMAVYLGFEVKKYTVDMILNVLILVLGTLVIQKGLYVIVEDIDVVGKICILTRLITFFNPMLLLYQVFKDKNFRLISLRNTSLYCLASLAWIIFGKTMRDTNLILANICSLFLCLIQIFVIFYFKKRYSGYKSNTIGIESSQVEEIKKEENAPISNFEEDKQDKGKEKPVKIVSKVESQ